MFSAACYLLAVQGNTRGDPVTKGQKLTKGMCDRAEPSARGWQSARAGALGAGTAA